MAFDVTRAATFEAVEKWKSDLDCKLILPTGQPVPTVLLANKVSAKKMSFTEGLIHGLETARETITDILNNQHV